MLRRRGIGTSQKKCGFSPGEKWFKLQTEDALRRLTSKRARESKVKR